MWTKKNYIKLTKEEEGKQSSFGNVGKAKF
jgi:hypothetical protein